MCSCHTGQTETSSRLVSALSRLVPSRLVSSCLVSSRLVSSRLVLSPFSSCANSTTPSMADDFEALSLLSLILLCEEEDENKPFREFLSLSERRNRSGKIRRVSLQAITNSSFCHLFASRQDDVARYHTCIPVPL
jgi:hypothetical protein